MSYVDGPRGRLSTIRFELGREVYVFWTRRELNKVYWRTAARHAGDGGDEKSAGEHALGNGDHEPLASSTASPASTHHQASFTSRCRRMRQR